MNSGDTTWILICTALVLLMTPGLALFYGGLVRESNTINTMKMSFISLGVVALAWIVVGYSLAFGPGNGVIGGLTHAGLAGVGLEPSPYAETVPHIAFMAFQMMFAIITPALISGAVVGRMKFKAYIAFILAWALLVYAPLARWVWGKGGWIGELGALDFAGGTVVHINAGVAALVAAMRLGPRLRSPHARDAAGNTPHNVPMVLLGTALLWFGWFGFNAGSSLAANGVAALALVTTMLGAAAGMSAWVGADIARKGKAPATGAAMGAVVGLVAITPGAGFVPPLAAVIIGAVSSLVCRATVDWLQRTALDDTLDVFACHGLGGICGSILTGVFASRAVNPGGADGLLRGNPDLMVAQLIGIGVSIGLSLLGTTAILLVVERLVGLRASRIAEIDGIDAVEHAETAYVRSTVTRAPSAPR